MPRPDPPEDIVDPPPIDIVDPLPADDPPSSTRDDLSRLRIQFNRLVWVLVVVLIVGAVIEGVCGSGNCSSAGSGGGKNDGAATERTDVSTSAPTVDEPTDVPTSAPTNKPTDAPAIAPPPDEPTGVPTSAPTRPISARAAAITSFINEITFSPLPLVYLLNPDVAATNGEGLALQWLIDDDPLQLSSSNTLRLQQQYALATLFFQQTESEPSWYGFTGWLTDSNECEWFGITCNSESVVTAIDLSFKNLQGTIPADIGLLMSLTDFYVQGNALTGTLPSSIGQWTSLTNFWVAVNGLTGTLPSSIGQWTSLTYFSVTANRLRGMIPNSVGNWTQIHMAYFDDNAFTGTMPSGICNARTLRADCVSEVVCTCCTFCY